MENEAWIIDRPSLGEYSPDCLRWEHRASTRPNEGEVLVKTLLISLDPTSRNWLKLEKSSAYLPLAIGSVMIGQAVGIVVESRSAHFTPGDMVKGMWGWERYSLAQPMFIERFFHWGRICRFFRMSAAQPRLVCLRSARWVQMML